MAFNPVRDIWANLRQLANNDVWQISDAGVPTDGTSGTGADFAGPGSVYTNITTGQKYINTGTKASPIWQIIGVGSFDPGYAIVTAGTASSGATTATTIAVSGALTTDLALATWRNAPQTLAHIVALATTGQINIAYNTTVGTAGTIQYALIRAI
jgi:hypothetical protein